MRDFSSVLPSWAIREGYHLEGGEGTYDELYLYKDFKILRMWRYDEPVPNMIEMEGIINGFESQKVS